MRNESHNKEQPVAIIRKASPLTLRGRHVVDGTLGAFGFVDVTRADNELRIIAGPPDNPDIFHGFKIDEYALVNGMRVTVHVWDPRPVLPLVYNLTATLYTKMREQPHTGWADADKGIYFPGSAIIERRMGRWEIGPGGERTCTLWQLEPDVISKDHSSWIILSLGKEALEIFHRVERSPSPEKFVSVEVRLIGDVVRERRAPVTGARGQNE